MTDELAKTLPLLEELGYEVSIFRVQMGLPPTARLQLRARGNVSADKIAAVSSKTPNTLIANALVTSAITARRIQSTMRLAVAVLDADLSLTPRVRMSFRRTNEVGDRDTEIVNALLGACAQ